MPLLPIKEDSQRRTLAGIPGLLEKLAYVAELREGDKYVHWGVTRVYGEEATQRVLGEIHRALFSAGLAHAPAATGGGFAWFGSWPTGRR